MQLSLAVHSLLYWLTASSTVWLCERHVANTKGSRWLTSLRRRKESLAGSLSQQRHRVNVSKCVCVCECEDSSSSSSLSLHACALLFLLFVLLYLHHVLLLNSPDPHHPLWRKIHFMALLCCQQHKTCLLVKWINTNGANSPWDCCHLGQGNYWGAVRGSDWVCVKYLLEMRAFICRKINTAD